MNRVYEKFDLITGKWWFIIIFLIVGSLPPYVSKGFSPERTQGIIIDILKSSIMNSLPQSVYIIFKIIPIVLIILLLLLRNRLRIVFTIYVGISYILFALLQGIAFSPNFGFGIITGNMLMFLIVSASWFLDISFRKNDFENIKLTFWKYLMAFLSIIAFWYPLNQKTGLPDFNPLYFITNGAGLAFCMMTPVYLFILLLIYPRVNRVTLRITSLAGFIIGIYNMLINFGVNPEKYWWNGVLHFPLLIISLISLILSFRRTLKEVE